MYKPKCCFIQDEKDIHIISNANVERAVHVLLLSRPQENSVIRTLLNNDGSERGEIVQWSTVDSALGVRGQNSIVPGW